MPGSKNIKRQSTVCKHSTCSRARRILRQEMVYQVPELKGLKTSPRARSSGDESPSIEVWRRVLEPGGLATSLRARRSSNESPSSEVWLQVPELRALATGSRARWSSEFPSLKVWLQVSELRVVATSSRAHWSSESITTLSLYLSCFFFENNDLSTVCESNFTCSQENQASSCGWRVVEAVPEHSVRRGR
jgi:hypothetical protein